LQELQRASERQARELEKRPEFAKSLAEKAAEIREGIELSAFWNPVPSIASIPAMESIMQKPLDTPPTTDVHSTLSSRGNTHGSFVENGSIMQDLKDRARNGPNWYSLLPHQREAIDMILHKIGRILCGNPHHHDHWHDIAGYATLVEQSIPPVAAPTEK